MSSVRNDPAEVRRFMAALRSFNSQLTTSNSRMRNQLNNLNGVWRDAEYEQFRDELETALAVFERYLGGADNYLLYLERKAAPLERYLGR
jgi:hypothetical protein